MRTRGLASELIRDAVVDSASLRSESNERRDYLLHTRCYFHHKARVGPKGVFAVEWCFAHAGLLSPLPCALAAFRRRAWRPQSWANTRRLRTCSLKPSSA